ncbi:hypothetical protein E6O75_ATG06249 [Venturia nashicola]|uniref:Uncharacterized protein n=1 Tax=Venturia nashicola TaxID=86259 RepID=A0A4Z1NZS1_9PEZI|nr:hypothetical protein E6O75_ATG06249 [Venturia nashicola]
MDTNDFGFEDIESASRSLSCHFRNLSRFEIYEKFEHGSSKSFRGRFNGILQILPAREGQDSDITVDVAITASDSNISMSVHTEMTESSLTINLPRCSGRDIVSDSCLNVNVSIFVRPRLNLEKLLLDLDASRVKIPSKLDVNVDASKINLHAGGLDATPFFTSRETHINLGAGSVTGEYSLHDLLQIHTHAGSVTINVLPQEADKEKPVSAFLSIGSDAGSVHAAYPPLRTPIPNRQYCTAIWSHQGSINGNYIHGTKTTLESNSGSITADILPYIVRDISSTLHTRTDAGAQRINILSPYNAAGTHIEGLASSHSTQAASLTIAYPPEWEGLIEGRTGVGTLTLRGDVRVIKEGGVGPVGGYVLAEKGDGDSKMDFRTSAGSAYIEMK